MRFTSITIENFKNVEYGELTFDNPRRPDGPSILALYGQNGSGKSAVIDCFKIFKRLALGQEIPSDYAYYITSGKGSARIIYQFEIEDEAGNKGLVKYAVRFSGIIEKVNGGNFVKKHNEVKRLLEESMDDGFDEEDAILLEYLENDSLMEDGYLRLGPGAVATASIISEEVMYRGPNDKKLHTIFSCTQDKKVSPKGLEGALLKYWNNRKVLDDFYIGKEIVWRYGKDYISWLHEDGRSVFFSRVCVNPVDDAEAWFSSANGRLTKFAKVQNVRSKTAMYWLSQQDDAESQLSEKELEAADRVRSITKGIQKLTQVYTQYNMSVVESKDAESIEDHQWLNFYCSKDAIESTFSKTTIKTSINDAHTEKSNPISSREKYLSVKANRLLAHGGALHVSTSDSSPSQLFPHETAIINETLRYVNNLIGAVIPGLQLALHCETYPSTFFEPQQEMDFVYLQSIREDRTIPLSSESRGIQKIISIIFLLIDVYNNKDAVVVIDELDAGIFEFLLGEILEIIAQEGEGQLIFTSHNLRPLEVIDKGYIAFSTANPENRYIRLKGVKPTNNLRDYYFRTILLGGQEENVYNYLSKGKLSLAFLKSATVYEDVAKYEYYEVGTNGLLPGNESEEHS